jgi:hypothetical protein
VSAKTRYLLNRSGRNEFGDPCAPPLPRYKPTAEQLKRDDKLIARHRALNEAFVAKHGPAWLARFEKLPQADAWKRIYPHGRPALSTFRSRAREFASFEEFLLFVLLSEKKRSLSALGYSSAQMRSEMAQFADCGRYFVSYGNSRRTFCSVWR